MLSANRTIYLLCICSVIVRKISKGLEFVIEEEMLIVAQVTLSLIFILYDEILMKTLYTTNLFVTGPTIFKT